MNIVLSGNLSDDIANYFQKQFPEDRVEWMDTEEKYHEYSGADCIVVRTFKTPEKVFQNNPNLKAVLRWGAGYDSVDIRAAASRGVIVANAPGINAYAVSELAVAMMMALKRNIFRYWESVRQGQWDGKLFAAATETLNWKTVGIIGAGNIGRRVARQVRSFGSDVCYWDAYRLSEADEKELGLTFLGLEELLKQSDIISLHVPLTGETRHLIGEKELDMMKPGSVLINTARGGLVDDEALYEALCKGKLSGAGLDCLENENVKENKLCTLDNVIITPHIGGTSKDLSAGMAAYMAGQIRMLKAEGTVKNIVSA